MRIRKQNIIVTFTSLLVLFCIITDVKLINDVVSYGLRVYIRFGFIFLLFLFGAIKKKTYTKVFLLINLLIIFVFIGCVLNGYDWTTTIGLITVPYLPCLYLEYNKDKLLLILKNWMSVLFALMLIDIASMVIFPDGLYFDGLYSENWFLGYKSNRLNYYLPLCVFAALISYQKRKKYGLNVFFIIGLSIYGLLFADATGAGFSVLVFGILLLLFNLIEMGKIKGGTVFIKNLLSYKNAILFYFCSALMVFMISYLPFVQKIVFFLFQKDATLTTRTAIWAACFLQVCKHPLIGIGLVDSSTFIRITGNYYASSAHNMILTILVAGGFCALITYIAIMIFSIKHAKIGIKFLIPLLLGITSVWIVGLTSSSFVFSLFGLVFYEVLALLSESNWA